MLAAFAAQFPAAALSQVAVVHIPHLDPKQFFGIPFALLGAVLLALGAQLQSRGLNKTQQQVSTGAGGGFSLQQMLGLLRRPSWVIGTALLGLAVVAQLVSLYLSPLIIVQPLGVVGLVITSILNARMSGINLSWQVGASIAAAVAGIVVFVTVAAFTAADQPLTSAKIIIILVLFAVFLLGTLLLTLVFRYKRYALIYIAGAGMLYGFVATFAKLVLGRIAVGNWGVLTWLCIFALVLGTVLGMFYVQYAHASGPPDLVVAGLTVIDPIIAVLIGIAVLGEAATAGFGAAVVFVLSGAFAVLGVLGLAKYHPQADNQSAVLDAEPI